MHFDRIQWEIQRVANAAVYSLLYGDDRSQSKSFYESSVVRKNKEILLRTASQVYAYLDGTISEFADINDYVFRVSTRITVNKTNGLITDEPNFEVQIYKYFGRVSAKGIESPESVAVAFLGKEDDSFIGPKMNKELTKAVKEFKSMKFELYKTAKSAPGSLRSKVVGNFPTLIVGDQAFAVKLKISEAQTNYIYIEDNDKEITVSDEKDLVVFLSKKSGLKPDILGSGTAFESPEKMGREARDISNRINENATSAGKEVNLIETLGLDDAVDQLFKLLESCKKKKLAVEFDEEEKDIETKLTAVQTRYHTFKVEYESSVEEIKNLDQQFEKSVITPDNYQVQRFKLQNAKTKAKDELVDLQKTVKSELSARVADLTNKIQSKLGK
ncbi:MAG: hypothetical protein ACYCPP_03650 [Nitrososphaerales archaeon]